MCRLLQVSHGGFYAWVGRTRRHGALANERLSGLIGQCFAQSHRRRGSPRVWRDLIAWVETVGEIRVARPMKRAWLKACRKRRRWPAGVGVRQEHCIAANVLDRTFVAVGANRKCVADFTYRWTTEGWLYLAVVIDLCSRTVVGLSTH
jgi:putative transposase